MQTERRNFVHNPENPAGVDEGVPGAPVASIPVVHSSGPGTSISRAVRLKAGDRAARLAVAILALAAFSACTSVDASSARPEYAVFSSTRDGRSAIYTVNSRDGIVSRLSDIDGADSAPAIAPNRRLVAFLSDRSGKMNIWLMDTLGQQEHLAFPAEPGPVTQFYWSPDSARIAYAVQQDGGGTAIYVGDLTTGASGLLVSEPVALQLGNWSPDGEWVVYAMLQGEERGIYRRNPKGVDQIRLTAGMDASPRWAPKGTLVAFNRRSEGGTLSLHVVNSTGDGERLLTPGSTNDWDYEWAPDASRLVFVSDRDGNQEVYSISSDSKSLSRLTTNRSAEMSPRWSRDGRYILFLSNSDGDFDFYTMHPNGSSQARVTDTAYDEFEPDW